MVRRAGLVAVLLMLLSTSSVFAATSTVTVTNRAFKPATVNVTVGNSVKWTNNTLKSHAPTPSNNWSFSGVTVAPGASATVTATQAGSFPYFCALHPTKHSGTVSVRMGVSPAAGNTTTFFSITLGTVTAPGVLVHQVYVRQNGGAWQLRVTTNAASVQIFFPSTGTWDIQTRMKYVLGGALSGYSPISTVVVF